MLSLTNCSTAADELSITNQLRDDLFVKQNYDRMARPVKNHTSTIEVYVDAYIVGIVDLVRNLFVSLKSCVIRLIYIQDPNLNTLTTNAMFRLTWIDEHLTWNSSNYGGLTDIVLRSNEAWLPDFTLWHHLEDNFKSEALFLNSNGRVEWWSTSTLKTTCRPDLTNYPNDRQQCKITFANYMSSADEVNLTCNLTRNYYNIMYENPQWQVTNVTASRLSYMSKYDFMDRTRIRLFISITRLNSLMTYYIHISYILAIMLNLVSYAYPLQSDIRPILCASALLILIALNYLITLMIGSHYMQIPKLGKI